jgi:hypothetical protein
MLSSYRRSEWTSTKSLLGIRGIPKCRVKWQRMSLRPSSNIAFPFCSPLVPIWNASLNFQMTFTKLCSSQEETKSSDFACSLIFYVFVSQAFLPSCRHKTISSISFSSFIPNGSLCVAARRKCVVLPPPLPLFVHFSLQ